jgi:hypothetical protein
VYRDKGGIVVGVFLRRFGRGVGTEDAAGGHGGK